MHISLKKVFTLTMLIALVLSCNNNNTTKQSSNNLKDTLMENKILEKNTQHLTEITGTVGKISLVQQGEGGTPILFIHSFGGSSLKQKKWKRKG